MTDRENLAPEELALETAMDWYEGKIEPDDFKDEMLSDIERENANLIKKVEEDRLKGDHGSYCSMLEYIHQSQGGLLLCSRPKTGSYYRHL